ncbi:dienelactone hydrolase family protein [Saccharopolyspora sp. CA-218241]|uniref:dienelactone hydrolase family protein n=1 Tax=Saccharopolyspora sp. CA-218241 TaxID=3240027 RepID=UPI003D98CA91
MAERSSYLEVDGLRAHVTAPEGRPTGAVLLLPMITGIGEQVREYARLIVEETGAVALCWDPWHGKSSDDTPVEELHGMLGQLDDDAALAEQRTLLDHLVAEHGVEHAGVIGWCLGGRFALLLAAHDDRVSSVVAYHPTIPGETPPNHTRDAIAAARTLDVPVMVHYPGEDSIVPHHRFSALQSALQERATSAATVVHLYPRAQHGFSDRGRHGERANADAWALSWPQTTAFLDVAARLRAPDA